MSAFLSVHVHGLCPENVFVTAEPFVTKLAKSMLDRDLGRKIGQEIIRCVNLFVNGFVILRPRKPFTASAPPARSVMFSEPDRHPLTEYDNLSFSQYPASLFSAAKLGFKKNATCTARLSAMNRLPH